MENTPICLSRSWKKSQNVAFENPSLDISIMHWNVLADFLAYDFEKVPDLYLKWHFRFPMIIQHIKDVNADIIGLSEVDVYPIYEQYQEELAKMGYLGLFHEKSDRKSGSAIFYKKDKI